jgi:hypothetical protein
LATGGEITRGIVVVVHGQPDLFEVILAAHAGRRLADLLHRWQKQANENRDDGNHDQKLNQGEPSPPAPVLSQTSHGKSPSRNGNAKVSDTVTDRIVE